MLRAKSLILAAVSGGILSSEAGERLSAQADVGVQPGDSDAIGWLRANGGLLDKQVHELVKAFENTMYGCRACGSAMAGVELEGTARVTCPVCGSDDVSPDDATREVMRAHGGGITRDGAAPTPSASPNRGAGARAALPNGSSESAALAGSEGGSLGAVSPMKPAGQANHPTWVSGAGTNVSTEIGSASARVAHRSLSPIASHGPKPGPGFGPTLAPASSSHPSRAGLGRAQAGEVVFRTIEESVDDLDTPSMEDVRAAKPLGGVSLPSTRRRKDRGDISQYVHRIPRSDVSSSGGAPTSDQSALLGAPRPARRSRRVDGKTDFVRKRTSEYRRQDGDPTPPERTRFRDALNDNSKPTTAPQPSRTAPPSGERRAVSLPSEPPAYRGGTSRRSGSSGGSNDSGGGSATGSISHGPLPDRIGNWDVLGVVGTGGLGTVFHCNNPILDRNCAVKLLKATDRKALARFRSEARILARLDHPNIVKVLDYGEQGDMPYLVMELVDGASLRDLVRRDGPQSVTETIHCGIECCEALAASHAAGVIHRDVKPANILLGPAGVKVVDFGIARTDQSNRLTATGSVVGTPTYMSPEQIQGDDITTAVDTYALGATLFYVLTGKPPFDGRTFVEVMQKHISDPFPRARDLRRSVPQELDDLLHWMCEKRPTNRPASMEVVASELLSILEQENTRTTCAIGRRPEAGVIELPRRTGHVEVAKLLEGIHSLNKLGASTVVFDFKRCVSINPWSLDQMMRECRRLKLAMNLAAIPRQASILLEMTGYSSKAKRFATIEDALQSFPDDAVHTIPWAKT